MSCIIQHTVYTSNMSAVTIKKKKKTIKQSNVVLDVTYILLIMISNIKYVIIPIRIFVWYLNYYYKVCNIIYSSDKVPIEFL